MKQIRWTFLCVLLFIACEHKELCYSHPHFVSVRVTFDWSQIYNHEKPSGMRVIFFPKDEKGESWTFDFPDGKDRVIEIPENDYQVVSFNYDTEGIAWGNSERFADFTAGTREVSSPEGVLMYTTPSWLCGDDLSDIRLKGIPAGTEVTVPIVPKNRVCRYTYEVNGIRNLSRVTDVRASLSNMASSLLMAGDRLPKELSESLLFGGTLSDKQVKGGFYTFGYCQEGSQPNMFKLYLKNRNGSMYVLEQDVSQQILDIPISGHLADVHLVIHLDYDIPDNPGEGGAGFEVDVDDWCDVNEDIKL